MSLHTRPTICGTSHRVTWDTSTAMHEKCNVSCWFLKNDCMILLLRKWPWEALPSESKFCFCKPPWASTWQRSVGKALQDTSGWLKLLQSKCYKFNLNSNLLKLWNPWLIKLPDIKAQPECHRQNRLCPQTPGKERTGISYSTQIPFVYNLFPESFMVLSLDSKCQCSQWKPSWLAGQLIASEHRMWGKVMSKEMGNFRSMFVSTSWD